MSEFFHDLQYFHFNFHLTIKFFLFQKLSFLAIFRALHSFFHLSGQGLQSGLITIYRDYQKPL